MVQISALALFIIGMFLGMVLGFVGTFFLALTYEKKEKKDGK